MAENQAPQSVENRNISITDEGEGNADVAQPDNTPEDDIDINIEDDNRDNEENGDDDIIIHEPESEPDIEIEDSSTQNSGQTPPTGAPAMPPPPPPPPPPPSEPPEPPEEEATEEQTEQPETNPEEERDERQDYLLELIDDFADLSDEELAGMTEFQELSTKEKVVKALKTGARRAVVYAVVGVGAYALLHAAPAVIIAGAVGGFAGSSLGRGLVDAIKSVSGAEKKEMAIQKELSDIEVGKLTNLRNLALRARTLMDMPAGQGQSAETGVIETAEQAKADFLNTLIEYNDNQSQSNRQIAGLRKKLSRSRIGWGVAKGVVGLVGGIAGGMAGAAELKAVLAEKIAEKGMHMTGEGLGQLDPGMAVGHNVHLEGGKVVFDYAGGAGGQELAGVYSKIAENPELAQYFQSELISRGMHEAGDALGQEFMQKVGQVASERAAEYVAGAVGVAEATDAVWRNARRNRPDSWVRGASDEVRGEAGEYQGDFQAEANTRQNERFRSMFVDQNGQVPEGVPSIGEAITLDQTISLSSPEGDIIINPGEHLQIMGVDQNGNVLVTHVEGEQLLAFQQDDFYRNIIEPRIADNVETDEKQDDAELDELVVAGESPPVEEKNLLEKERDELRGTTQTVEIDKVIDRKNFVCSINDKPRRVTIFRQPPGTIVAGFKAKIKILEVHGDDNQFVRAEVERVLEVDSEANSYSVKEISEEEKNGIMTRLVLSITNIEGESLSKNDLTKYGLEPKYKILFGEKEVWASSKTFIYDNRICGIAYYKENDAIKAMPFVQSVSQGLYRMYPCFSIKDGRIDWFSKAHGEECLALPAHLQKVLCETEFDKVTLEREEAEKVLVGITEGVEAQGRAMLRGQDILNEIDQNGTNITNNEFSLKNSRKPDPEKIIISKTENMPNFGGVELEWEYVRADSSKVNVKTYLSRNKEFRYIFNQDDRNRIWVAGVEVVNSPKTKYGLNTQWVNEPHLTTPADEYKTQLRGENGQLYYDDNNENNGQYADAYELYISKIPLITEYIKFINKNVERQKERPPETIQDDEQKNKGDTLRFKYGGEVVELKDGIKFIDEEGDETVFSKVEKIDDKWCLTSWDEKKKEYTKMYIIDNQLINERMLRIFGSGGKFE